MQQPLAQQTFPRTAGALQRIRNSTLNVASPSFLHIALVQYNVNVSGPAQVREILPNGSVVVPNSLYVSRAHAIHSSQAKMRPSRSKRMPASALSSYTRSGYGQQRSRKAKRKQKLVLRDSSDISQSPYYSAQASTAQRAQSRSSSRLSAGYNSAARSSHRTSAERSENNYAPRLSSRQGRLRARPNTSFTGSRSHSKKAYQQGNASSVRNISSRQRSRYSSSRGRGSQNSGSFRLPNMPSAVHSSNARGTTISEQKYRNQQNSLYSRAQSALGASRSAASFSPYASGAPPGLREQGSVRFSKSHNTTSMPQLGNEPGKNYQSPYAQRSRQSSRQGRRLKSRQGLSSRSGKRNKALRRKQQYNHKLPSTRSRPKVPSYEPSRYSAQADDSRALASPYNSRSGRDYLLPRTNIRSVGHSASSHQTSNQWM